MRVAKNFGWEAAHRLPTHEGLCRHLHGHSYRMTVEVDGDSDDRGIVIDFQEIKVLVKPLVDRWDHSTLISETDTELREVLERLGDRYVVLPGESTAENLCIFVADWIMEHGRRVLQDHGIRSISIRIHETDSCYAEHRVDLS